MNKIIPSNELAAAVLAAYPNVSESGGRPPIPVDRMMRMYFLHAWLNLRDLAVREALYDSVVIRASVLIVSSSGLP
jgi:transposase, IS5 family